MSMQVWLMSFLWSTSFSLILGRMPYVIERFGGMASPVGLAESCANLVGMFAIFALGRLRNKYGLRALLTAVILLELIGKTVVAIAVNLPILLIGILFRCLEGAMEPIAKTIILESCPPQEIPDKIATWGIVTAATLLFGPLLSLALASLGFEEGVLPISVLMNMACLALGVRVRLPCEASGQQINTSEKGLPEQELVQSVFACWLIHAACDMLVRGVPLLLALKYGLEADSSSAAMVVIVLVGALANLFCFPKIHSVFGARFGLVLVGAATMVMCVIADFCASLSAILPCMMAIAGGLFIVDGFKDLIMLEATRPDVLRGNSLCKLIESVNSVCIPFLVGAAMDFHLPLFRIMGCILLVAVAASFTAMRASPSPGWLKGD